MRTIEVAIAIIFHTISDTPRALTPLCPQRTSLAEKAFAKNIEFLLNVLEITSTHLIKRKVIMELAVSNLSSSIAYSLPFSAAASYAIANTLPFLMHRFPGANEVKAKTDALIKWSKEPYNHPESSTANIARRVFRFVDSCVSSIMNPILGAQASSIKTPTLEEINQALHSTFLEIQKLTDAPAHPTGVRSCNSNPEAQMTALKGEMSSMLATLPPGTTITRGKHGRPIASALDSYRGMNLFMPLQHLAESTGGLVGLSIYPGDFHDIIKTVFEHIFGNISPGQPIEIAFVIKTTSSMHSDIEQIKSALSRFADHYNQLQIDYDNPLVKMAIIEFGNEGESLYRMNTDLTSDLPKIIANLQTIAVTRARSLIRTFFAVLRNATNALSWSRDTKHIVISIQDSTSIYSEEATDELAKGNITIYPIIMYPFDQHPE